jgi:DNA polymerase alpha subunit A
MVDVYNEFNNLSDQYQVRNFKSRKITKKYAFDLPDVADESEYLEIRYSVSVFLLYNTNNLNYMIV